MAGHYNDDEENSQSELQVDNRAPSQRVVVVPNKVNQTGPVVLCEAGYPVLLRSNQFRHLNNTVLLRSSKDALVVSGASLGPKSYQVLYGEHVLKLDTKKRDIDIDDYYLKLCICISC